MEAAAAAKLARLARFVKLPAADTTSSRSLRSNPGSPELQPAAAKEALASTAGTKRRVADMMQQQQVENKKPRLASAADSSETQLGGVHSMPGSVDGGSASLLKSSCYVGSSPHSQADSTASATAASFEKLPQPRFTVIMPSAMAQLDQMQHPALLRGKAALRYLGMAGASTSSCNGGGTASAAATSFEKLPQPKFPPIVPSSLAQLDRM
jgi:hypothetical protein